MNTKSSVYQRLSYVWLFETSWTAAHQASLSFTISQSLPKLMSIESVMPSNHLILCRPLLLLPSIFPSIRVFSNESVLRISWPKYWSFSFSTSPSNEYSGLIFFRIDYFNLLAVQGSLKRLLQHHNSKASILQCLTFFTVQLSHPYMTTGKAMLLLLSHFSRVQLRAPKNWCFWTATLEKTLESPLDSKEIQQVHPKENQSWIFIGRTDTKAETPIVWPPYAKSWLFGKDSDAGRDWGQEEKGTPED